MKIVKRESGILAWEEEPKKEESIRLVDTEAYKTAERVNGALCDAIRSRLPGCGFQEVTIGCFLHQGCSPKQTVRWGGDGPFNKDGQRHHLPCPLCNPKAWLDFLLSIDAASTREGAPSDSEPNEETAGLHQGEDKADWDRYQP